MNLEYIENLYGELLHLSREEQLSELNRLCNDNVIKAEVTSLLEISNKSRGFLSNSPYAELAADCIDNEFCTGKRIACYQIVKTIGKGGMGVVFKANRVDGYYEQTVAIKVLNCSFRTSTELQRFQAERQILAGLQHPNITRLLDGGNTPGGLPYLVMEYVEGVPINDYCKINDLSINQKLHLFLKVCGAVQFAHQNLVIHRDLKPENILVTRYGNVKLIDFGTAKLLSTNQRSAKKYTISGIYPLTPEYAAPEQLTGEVINTATDVYALGVILNELLTGERPYQFPNESMSAIVSTVCNVKPINPSKIQLKDSGQLRGELDSIILRCLEKKNNQRYEIVALLSDDIKRYLQGLPVNIYRQSLWYRCQKFIQRNKLIVALSTVFILLVTGSSVVTAWQWYSANLERNRAELRYLEVRELANSFVFEFSDAIEDLPGTTRIRESLIKKGITYLDSLMKEKPEDDSLLIELANAYTVYATLQGNLIFQNLGDTKSSLKNYNKALEIREKLLRIEPHNIEFITEASNTQFLLTGMFGILGEIHKAQKSSDKCVALIREEGILATPRGQYVTARCYIASAHIYNLKKNTKISEMLMQKLGELYDRRQLDLSRKAIILKGIYFEQLAEIHLIKGNSEKAVLYQRQFVAIAEKYSKTRNNSVMLAYAYHGLAKKLLTVKQLAESMNSYEKTLDVWSEQLKLYPNDVRRLLGMAGLKADYAYALLTYFTNKHSSTIDKAYACKLFYQSEEILNKLNLPNVGYGIRVFNLPEPEKLRPIFNEICV